MITNQLFKVFGKVTTLPNEYETRFQELITIAAAVGVAATFAAPIGSVLYSIEIVKSFFAVRSYWEGFFATTWGALLWRLFAVWFKLEENISHLLLTDFRKLYPYETLEIILFALLGILCGLISYLFVQFQRSIVLLNRRKNPVSRFLARFPLFYPLFISFLIASLKYPHGVAMFSSAHLAMEESMHEMFSNFTWHDFHFRHDSNDGNHAYPINSTNPSDHLYSFQSHIVHNWSSEHTNVFANTFLFFLSNFFTIAIASTVPVPGGLIVPLFMLGAPVGRFFGEVAAFIFPHGINPLNHSYGIVPGAYAVAASAALCGGITGSLSVAVIAFEITGQLTHFLPVIVCVLCSNLVSRYLGPTIYESTIELKNLPFLPTMIKASAVSHKVLVEDFMDTDVQFVWSGCTFHTLNNIVNSPNLLAFYPFVSAPESKYLLGIIHHLELKSLLDAQMSKSAFKKDKDDSQVSTNGRFQILSSFGPYRVAYTNVSSLAFVFRSKKSKGTL
jgi:chloride channel 2